MEVAQPNWSKHCGKYFGYTAIMFFYEFVGTFLLVCAINATGGNAWGIGLVLLFLLQAIAPITGAHFNPAVSIGVFINQGKGNDTWTMVIQRFVMMLNFICAQMIGGLIGVHFIYSLIENKNVSDLQRAKEFPHLFPRTKYWGQALCLEMFATFVFVMANLIVKHRGTNAVFAGAGDYKGWFGTFTIAATLASMIKVCGPHTGASLNPAVAVANHNLTMKLFDSKTVHDDSFKVYILGGILGGVIAGFTSWAHGALVTYREKCSEECDKADEEK